MTDLAALSAALLDKLRAAGVSADPRGAAAFAAALPGVLAAEGDRRSRFYWTARVTLVRDPRDLTTFDRVVGDLIGSPAPIPRRSDAPTNAGRSLAPADVSTTEAPHSLPWAMRPRAAKSGDAQGRERSLLVPVSGSGRTPVDPEPFDELDERLLSDLANRLRETTQRRPRRRTRRSEVGGRGRLDLRRTAQRWRRTGGEPMHLVHTRPSRRPRRLILLCDVSESMSPYVTAFLHLMRAASLDRAETFAFGTSLTRLSPALRRRTPSEAVAEASAAVADRYAGTRIASSLRALIRSHHGELLRGAVVVIASDGWDTDPPEHLAAQMARVARRAHRVVWANPRAGAPGFRPIAAGMAAALPYCDTLLPAATPADLADVVEALSPDRAWVVERASSTASRTQRGETA